MSDLGSGDTQLAGSSRLHRPHRQPPRSCLSLTRAAQGRHAPGTPHFHGRCPLRPRRSPTGPCGHCTLLPPCTQLSKRVCCTHTTGDWMAITVYRACNAAHGPALPRAASPGSPLVTSFHRRSCFGASCKVEATGTRGPTGARPKRPPSGTCTDMGPGPCVHRSLCPSWLRAEGRNERRQELVRPYH